MGTLANISGKEAAKAFAKAGWNTVGQRANLSIPHKKNYRSAHCEHSSAMPV
ncbi:MAG TPA: hypothetical protein VNU94_00220 [Acidobacteriaceae bacterium]|jgi:hypothetical protein|nr:hypothetical protein [Acidobacteriaceae bacterium]